MSNKERIVGYRAYLNLENSVSEEALRMKKRYEKNRLEAKAVGCEITDEALYEMQRKKKVQSNFFEGIGIGLFVSFLIFVAYLAGGIWVGLQILALL